MALDPIALDTPGTPEYWMRYLAARLLDRNRLKRLALLQSYLAGCPPMSEYSISDRRGYYQFQRLAQANMARKIVRTKRDRMRVRSIRTAAATDDRGDMTAWRYWMRSGLYAASKQVHSDQVAFAEGYVRVSLAGDGTPIALRRDPWSCIAIPDPLDPMRTLAAFELVYDDITGRHYAYLWTRGKNAAGERVGQQWVAVTEPSVSPQNFVLTGVPVDEVRKAGLWWPRLSFVPADLTMRPNLADVPESERDDGAYCQDLAADVVPVFGFGHTEQVGAFESSQTTLNRINRTICDRVIIQAMQAYKQRAMTQDLVPTGQQQVDRLPATNPKTGEPIAWGDIFQPGPDALWKLPPGVKIWESAETNLASVLSAAKDDLRILGSETDTPLPLLSDDVNQSAEGAQYNREAHIFGVENYMELAGGSWGQVIACMFLFAPDSDRYVPAGRGKPKVDRADPGQIVIDWAPAERFSLAERADADSKNKTLSLDDAARVIWGMSPDEVAANRERRKADIAELPLAYRLSELPAGYAANEVPPAAPEPAPAAPKPVPAPTN